MVTNDLVDESGHPTRAALDRVLAVYRRDPGCRIPVVRRDVLVPSRLVDGLGEPLLADGGARDFLRDREDVHTLDMPNAAVDIDTPADLQTLTNYR